MKALGESEFVLFEWRRIAFLIVKCKGQERRVYWKVDGYI
jgi:hypothetical protein